jgi:N-ethylmaleimide reductase
MTTDTIFEPVTIGKLDLPHRLAMAPMTRSRATADTGLVGDHQVEYYTQRAGAALIVTEATQPTVRGQGYIQTPGIHSAEQIAAWRKVTEAVHAKGGRIFLQLMHSGRIGHPYLYPDGGLPVGPSPVASGDSLFTADQGMLEHPVPRELTLDDIAGLVDAFAGAARNAVAAGFDGVELHGANGYLIHQFLGDSSNRRTDAYGGSVAGRIRFAVEVVRAVSDAIGPERVGLRVSPGNGAGGVVESDLDAVYGALADALNPYPLAYLHVMEAVRPVTELIRSRWNGPLVLNAQYGDEDPVEGAARLLDAGLADVIALGRPWLANPDLMERVRAGGPYNEADDATFYGGDHRGYTDYPRMSG